MRLLTVREYEPLELGKHELTDEQAESLHARASGRLTIEAPGPATGHKWRLTPGGWVGYWPISEDLALSLQPRVEIGNIFRMLEYAYDLKSFEMFQGVHGCSSLAEMYQRLAVVLAKRALDRNRRGLHRDYVPQEERLTHLRGRIDLPQAMGRPWDPHLPCRFQEHTADIDDNAILTQALGAVARSGLCSGEAAATVRRAYRVMAGASPARGATAAECLGRLYHRLNQDYEPMHGLCRFFLEHSGPTHAAGDHAMIPFVVNMPLLFEKFVARWLHAHLPPELGLSAQHEMSFGDNGELQIRIDLLLKDRDGRALAVLDTKYKITDKPSMSDCEQVVACAVGSSCRDAVLIYPKTLAHPLDVQFGDVRVRTMACDLSQDLEAAGQQLLSTILS